MKIFYSEISCITKMAKSFELLSKNSKACVFSKKKSKIKNIYKRIYIYFNRKKYVQDLDIYKIFMFILFSLEK